MALQGLDVLKLEGGAARPEPFEEVSLGPRPRPQHREREDGDVEADPREELERHLRGGAPRRVAAHVHHLRPRHRPGEGLELLLGEERVRERHVRSRLPVAVGPLDRRIEPGRAAGVGARDDDEPVVPPRVRGGPELPFHLLAGDELLALDVAAPLGVHLVLEVDGRDPRRLELPHGAHDVDGVPVPRIRIGNDGNRHRLGEVVGHHRHLPHGEEADIGLAQEGIGDPGTGHVDGREPRLLDQPCGQRIPGARHRGQLPRIQQGPQRPALRSRVFHLVLPPETTFSDPIVHRSRGPVATTSGPPASGNGSFFERDRPRARPPGSEGILPAGTAGPLADRPRAGSPCSRRAVPSSRPSSRKASRSGQRGASGRGRGDARVVEDGGGGPIIPARTAGRGRGRMEAGGGLNGSPPFRPPGPDGGRCIGTC